MCASKPCLQETLPIYNGSFIEQVTTPTNDESSFNHPANVIDRDSCVHQNQVFKKYCPFSMVVSLTRCDTPSNDGSFFNHRLSLNDGSTPSGSSSSFNHLTSKVSSNDRDSDCSDDEPNNYLESQESDDANSYFASPESDSEIVINEMDSRLNKLKNYQDQMEIQLKH